MSLKTLTVGISDEDWLEGEDDLIDISDEEDLLLKDPAEIPAIAQLVKLACEVDRFELTGKPGRIHGYLSAGIEKSRERSP